MPPCHVFLCLTKHFIVFQYLVLPCYSLHWSAFSLLSTKAFLVRNFATLQSLLLYLVTLNCHFIDFILLLSLCFALCPLVWSLDNIKNLLVHLNILYCLVIYCIGLLFLLHCLKNACIEFFCPANYSSVTQYLTLPCYKSHCLIIALHCLLSRYVEFDNLQNLSVHFHTLYCHVIHFIGLPFPLNCLKFACTEFFCLANPSAVIPYLALPCLKIR